jgi:hypothetical protein
MTPQTLLQMVQEVARRHGLSIPSAVVGSQDETVQQLYGLANETVEELNEDYKWVELVTALTFNHAGGTGGAALQIKNVVTASATAISDWKNYQPRTLWDVTGGLELIGPVTDQAWQAMINLNISAGRYSFRFYGDYLYIYPAPTVLATTTFRLEYYSSAPILATNGTTKKDLFTADTDTCRLPPRLVIMGLRWRYKKEKGLPYAEDKATYYEAAMDWSANTGQQTEVKMDQDTFSDWIGPMIVIPPGSWPV